MRPPRDDIAAPELAAGIPWIGGPAPKMEKLTAAGPALVHFWDLAQLNSVRAIPYVAEWSRRYADHGLAVLGVHSPRYPFTAPTEIVRDAVEMLALPYPVACDSEHRAWHEYGCEGWPSLFLWGSGGALRWFHFGEGCYEDTELAIQELLDGAAQGGDLPEPLAPLRPADAPDALVAPPSPEVLPGGSVYEPWTAGEDGESIELEYEAGGAYAAIEGDGAVTAALDGGEQQPAERITPGLWALAGHDRHEAHSLRLRPAPGQRVYSIAFAAAPR